MLLPGVAYTILVTDNVPEPPEHARQGSRGVGRPQDNGMVDRDAISRLWPVHQPLRMLHAACMHGQP